VGGLGGGGGDALEKRVRVYTDVVEDRSEKGATIPKLNLGGEVARDCAGLGRGKEPVGRLGASCFRRPTSIHERTYPF